MRFLQRRPETQHQNPKPAHDPFAGWEAAENAHSPRIPHRPLHEIFPRIGDALIETAITYQSHWSHVFSRDAGYLLTPLEMYSLCAMVKFHAPKRIFEIGTFHGTTTANLALNAPAGAKIHTLDLEIREATHPRIEEIFRARSIHRLTGNSQAFDFSPYDGKMDFIFVDGCHLKESVTKDTHSALQMLSPRGLLVWHDYSADNPDVIECLHTFARKIPITHISSTSLAVYRRD